MVHYFPEISETRMVQIKNLMEAEAVDEIKRLLMANLEQDSTTKKNFYNEFISLCLQKDRYDALLDIASIPGLQVYKGVCAEINTHAESLLARGEYETSFRLLTAFLPYQGPDRWHSFYQMGRIKMAKGECKEAVVMFCDSLIANPQSPETIKALNLALMEVRKIKPFPDSLLKPAIRKRMIYLKKKLRLCLPESEANAFKVYVRTCPNQKSKQEEL
jgi:hypothetical protein